MIEILNINHSPHDHLFTILQNLIWGYLVSRGLVLYRSGVTSL